MLLSIPSIKKSDALRSAPLTLERSGALDWGISVPGAECGDMRGFGAALGNPSLLCLVHLLT